MDIRLTSGIAIGNSNWFNKPSWCTSTYVQIHQQGKSTVATDDPIYWGYRMYAR